MPSLDDLTALAGFIPVMLAGGGAGMAYAGNKQMGANAKTAAQRQSAEQQFEALQLEQNAGQQVAAATQAAFEQRRNGELLQSRALAVAAASGAGALDPTVVTVISNIAGESTYRANMALYNGEEQARMMRTAAMAKRYNAGVALEAGDNKAGGYDQAAVGELFKGGMTLARYGMGYKDASTGETSKPAPTPTFNFWGTKTAPEWNGDNWYSA